MKKYVVFTVVLSAMVIFAANSAFAGGAVKLGIDFSGDQEFSGYGNSITGDAETGISIAAEFFGNIHTNVDLGGGLIAQLPRTFEFQGAEGKFNFIPLYGLIRIKGASGNVDPYGIGQLGYNFFMGDSDYKGDADLEGGLYYGLGGGILIKKRFSIEFIYSVNSGTLEYSGVNLDIENKQFTLSIGFNF